MKFILSEENRLQKYLQRGCCIFGKFCMQSGFKDVFQKVKVSQIKLITNFKIL